MVGCSTTTFCRLSEIDSIKTNFYPPPTRQCADFLFILKQTRRKLSRYDEHNWIPRFEGRGWLHKNEGEHDERARVSQVRHSNSQHRVISRSSVINERDECLRAFHIRSVHHFSSLLAFMTRWWRCGRLWGCSKFSTFCSVVSLFLYERQVVIHMGGKLRREREKLTRIPTAGHCCCVWN